MKPHIRWATVLVVVGAAVSAYWLSQRQPETPAGVVATYPLERNIRYSFRLRNTSGKFIEQANFWTYAPVQQTPTQKTYDIRSSGDYTLEPDGLGNQRLRFSLDNLPPYATRTITVDVRLRLSESPNKLPLDDSARFLNSERYVEVEAEKIRELARQLRGESPDQTVAASYRWITKNIDDAGYMRNDRGAIYAVNTGQGDCTEYMYLLMALNRSNGIPTQGISGFVVREDAVLRAHDYHNWTRVLIDGIWQLVDPHKAVFMDNQADYIAMRILGETDSGISENAQTLFGHDPGLDVVMIQ